MDRPQQIRHIVDICVFVFVNCIVVYWINVILGHPSNTLGPPPNPQLLPTPLIYIYIQERKNIFLNEQKVWMLLQKRTDTKGVGISSMRKSIYLPTTTPSSNTHRFHPFPLATPTFCSSHPLAAPIHSTHSTIVIHTLNFAQVKSMDDNCGEWVECMGVVSRRQVWLVGVERIYGCGYWVWL